MQDGGSPGDLFTHLPALHRKLSISAARPGGLNTCKLLVVGTPGLEGEAVVASVDLKMWMTHCSCHEGLTHLLCQDPTLTASSPERLHVANSCLGASAAQTCSSKLLILFFEGEERSCICQTSQLQCQAAATADAEQRQSKSCVPFLTACNLEQLVCAELKGTSFCIPD